MSNSNEYMRNYMREYRKKNHSFPKNKIRICPDCENREVEYHKSFCSECAEIRDQLNRDLALHKWLNGKGKNYHKNYWRKKSCQSLTT